MQFRKCNVTRTFSLLQAEGEVQALTRRIRLLEEDFDQTETRLQEASSKLEEASKAADESERSVAFFFHAYLNSSESLKSVWNTSQQFGYMLLLCDRVR